MCKSALYLSLTVGILLGFSPVANAVSISWGSLATSSVCPSFDCTEPAVNSIEAGEAGMQADVSTSINYNAGPIVPAASSSFVQATLDLMLSTQEMSPGGAVTDAGNTLTVALPDNNKAIDPRFYDPASLREVGVIPIPPSAWLSFSGLWIIGSLAHYRKSLARG